MIIYKVTNEINNKIYIGQTVNSLDKRKSQHKADSNNKKKLIRYFYLAINKYGFDCFQWEILTEAKNLEELNELEKYYIQLYDSTNPQKGYNISKGGLGRGNYEYSNETREKISKSLKDRYKNGLIVWNKGIKTNKSSWNKGLKFNHTQESKKKISNSQIIPIFMIDKSGNKTKYSSLKECVEKIGINRFTIQNCIKNNQPIKKGKNKGIRFEHSSNKKSKFNL